MQSSALAQARTQLEALIDAAEKGSIIPVRLPGQLSAVRDLLEQAEAEQQQALESAKQASTVNGDAAAVMRENAEFWKVAIHELRTPMTSIRGYGDMLSNTDMAGDLNEMQTELLGVVRNNSRRMETLLSDMSVINKLRAGILIISKKMDMVKNITQKAEKDLEPMAKALNRQLEFDIPQGLPFLNTDGDYIALAIVKLAENGLRYSQPETGKVVIRGRGEEDGRTLAIDIEDNGIGMSPAELARLGELYYRADHDLVRSYKGSGLGVPIAYGLIEALGGTHTVESEPDKGTRFTLRFPAMS